ncbi:hypothetical protein B0H11DRAFT_2434145 [Mycena galericulata]|nr:hypothetical protein B0H11DRAFT_2434145 [Mycena galericulata]
MSVSTIHGLRSPSALLGADGLAKKSLHIYYIPLLALVRPSPDWLSKRMLRVVRAANAKDVHVRMISPGRYRHSVGCNEEGDGDCRKTNEEDLPENWLKEPKVLVGIEPMRSPPPSQPADRPGRNRSFPLTLTKFREVNQLLIVALLLALRANVPPKKKKKRVLNFAIEEWESQDSLCRVPTQNLDDDAHLLEGRGGVNY